MQHRFFTIKASQHLKAVQSHCSLECFYCEIPAGSDLVPLRETTVYKNKVEVRENHCCYFCPRVCQPVCLSAVSELNHKVLPVLMGVQQAERLQLHCWQRHEQHMSTLYLDRDDGSCWHGNALMTTTETQQDTERQQVDQDRWGIWLRRRGDEETRRQGEERNAAFETT